MKKFLEKYPGLIFTALIGIFYVIYISITRLKGLPGLIGLFIFILAVIFSPEIDQLFKKYFS